MDKNKRKQIMQELVMGKSPAKDPSKEEVFSAWLKLVGHDDEAMDQSPALKERNPSEFSAQMSRVNPYSPMAIDKYKQKK